MKGRKIVVSVIVSVALVVAGGISAAAETRSCQHLHMRRVIENEEHFLYSHSVMVQQSSGYETCYVSEVFTRYYDWCMDCGYSVLFDEEHHVYHSIDH